MEVALNFAQVNMKTQLAGDNEPFVTTFGIRCVSADFDQEAADTLSGICADFWLDGSYGGGSGAYLPSQGSYLGLNIVVGPTGVGPILDSVEGADDGTGTTTLLTQNTTYLVKKLTGLGGRANRGRMFLPFARAENVSDTGQLDSATIEYLQGHVDQLLQDVNDADSPIGVMVLLHTDPGNTPDNITAMTVSPTVATQRRRLRP